MKSKMSFFNPALLKKNLSRFSPAWIITLIVLLLSKPLALLLYLEDTPRPNRAAAAVNFFDSSIFDIILAFFVAMIFAWLVFRYLHKANAAYMMHAFPMTRTCQFVTNTVSGLLFYLIPVAISAVCQLGILALYPHGVTECAGLVFAAAGKGVLFFITFYGLAVFCMHLSGNSIIAILSYNALNVLFLVLPVLTLLMLQFYIPSLYIGFSDSLSYLAPLFALITHDGRDINLVWSYACIGLVLLVLAWLLYRFRHVERAGDPMAYGWATILFRLVFTLSFALGLGWFLSLIFGLINDESFSFLPFALLGCLIGWFTSSMMIERTIKVFKLKKVWIGFVAFAAVLSAVILGAKYDVLGLQNRVPEVDQVESVELWGDSMVCEDTPIILTEQADIALIRSIQQNAIKLERTKAGTVTRATDLLGRNFRYYPNVICIRYRLKNGQTFCRTYSVESESDLSALDALCERADLARAFYDRVLPKRIQNPELEISKPESDFYGTYSTVSIGCRAPSALRDALLADAAAGDLPIPSIIGYGIPVFTDDNGQEFFLDLSEGANEGGNDIWRSFPIPATARQTLALFGQ